MEEKRIKQGFWVKGKLVLVENMSAGMCPQCGEKMGKADIGREVATLLEDPKRLRKARTISVPVIRFAEEIA